MKRKSLLIGALPAPYVGPWIPLTGSDTWRISDPGSLRDKPIRIILQAPNGEQIEMEKDDFGSTFHRFVSVRAVVVREFDSIRSLSIEVEAVPYA